MQADSAAEELILRTPTTAMLLLGRVSGKQRRGGEERLQPGRVAATVMLREDGVGD
jgi:hypothetical protein